MSTAVTKRSSQIVANDTYVLNTATPDSDRKQTLVIGFTPSGAPAYNGTILVQTRPRGSAQAFQTRAYTLLSTGATQATAIGAAATIQLDATGQEIALTSSGASQGSMQIDVTDSPES